MLKYSRLIKVIHYDFDSVICSDIQPSKYLTRDGKKIDYLFKLHYVLKITFAESSDKANFANKM